MTKKIQYDNTLSANENLRLACIGIASPGRKEADQKWKAVAVQALQNGADPNMRVLLKDGDVCPFELFYDNDMNEAVSLLVKNPQWRASDTFRFGQISMPLKEALKKYDFDLALKIISHRTFNPNQETGLRENMLDLALSMCNAKVYAGKWAQVAFKIISHPKCSKENRVKYLHRRGSQIKNPIVRLFFWKYSQNGCLQRD